MEKYILVTWLRSQELMEQPWFDECILVNYENHIEDIGPGAYLVPEQQYEEFFK